MRNRLQFAVLLLLVAILALKFLTFRLTLVPPGLTIDESSIGYNAALISKTLRDETGRKLPVFALTINGKDWKQPSSVYLSAIFFKIFGISVFNLRMVSVITTVCSLLGMIYLAYLLLGKAGAFISGIIFITTPIVVMHSHLAQENIMPVPLIITWLITILLYSKNKKLGYVLFSGFILGLSIYSYKGMRAIVPPLAILSVVYLFVVSEKSWKAVAAFFLGFSPFVLIMPWLNSHYAGALFDKETYHLKGFYDFLFPFLSSFDISALFIKGDITPWHSTGMHGVFLLATMPIFLVGLTSAFRAKSNKSFWIFLIWGFFLSPILFGHLNSVYRFSRLLVFVPFYVLFSTLGVLAFIESKKKILNFLLVLFMTLNFFDFLKYYWYTYPVVKRESFGQNTESAYKKLSQISRVKNKPAYIFVDDYLSQGIDSLFFEQSSFDSKINHWKPGDKIPSGSVLMAKLWEVEGFSQVDQELPFYFFTKD